MLVWNHKRDFKSNSRRALVQFWNYAYNFRPNCTPLSSITILNISVTFSKLFLFVSIMLRIIFTSCCNLFLNSETRKFKIRKNHKQLPLIPVSNCFTSCNESWECHWMKNTRKTSEVLPIRDLIFGFINQFCDVWCSHHSYALRKCERIWKSDYKVRLKEINTKSVLVIYTYFIALSFKKMFF